MKVSSRNETKCDYIWYLARPAHDPVFLAVAHPPCTYPATTNLIGVERTMLIGVQNWPTLRGNRRPKLTHPGC